ncbi:MAG: sigma-70 family RNA polymerase sigma factor [Oscillospiraceae bacterium]|nr:sigma-70 family RNA polymerase sigma factor [Oscillospiraceae bacterium]
MNSLNARSRDEAISENIGLVHSCAHRFKGRGIEYDDLFQAGCMGLVKAYDAFDFDRGVKFSTYAVPVILGEIKRLFRDGGSIKISRSLKELSLKVTRVRERLTTKLGNEPTVSQIAEELNITPAEAAEALEASHLPLSLTESDEEGGGQIDVLVESEEDRIVNIRSLSQIMSKMAEDDKKLIVLRYFKNKTQTETAKELNMTQVQVSRREKKLLTSMREKLLL